MKKKRGLPQYDPHYVRSLLGVLQEQWSCLLELP